jgi:dihydroorotase
MQIAHFEVLAPKVRSDLGATRGQSSPNSIDVAEKTEMIAELLLQPAFCLRARARFDATAPILP